MQKNINNNYILFLEKGENNILKKISKFDFVRLSKKNNYKKTEKNMIIYISAFLFVVNHILDLFYNLTNSFEMNIIQSIEGKDKDFANKTVYFYQ